jgi:hypothetical protein
MDASLYLRPTFLAPVGDLYQDHPASPAPFTIMTVKSAPLPDSESPDLGLAHPTPDECVKIWTSTSAAWRDSLTVPVYITESKYLTTIPLAKDGGMTIWALVDGTLPPDQRKIVSSW